LSAGHHIDASNFRDALERSAEPVLVLRFFEPDAENGWMRLFDVCVCVCAPVLVYGGGGGGGGSAIVCPCAWMRVCG
jgi:hypothetical protein